MIAGAFPVKFCGLFAKLCKTLNQIWKLGGLSCLPQRLNQPVNRRLIVGIAYQRLSALLDRLRVLSGVHIKLREDYASVAQRWLEAHGFFRRGHSKPEL